MKMHKQFKAKPCKKIWGCSLEAPKAYFKARKSYPPQ